MRVLFEIIRYAEGVYVIIKEWVAGLLNTASSFDVHIEKSTLRFKTKEIISRHMGLQENPKLEDDQKRACIDEIFDTCPFLLNRF